MLILHTLFFISVWHPDGPERTWIDARNIGIPPLSLPMPFELTYATLANVLGRPLSQGQSVAISGVPWNGHPTRVASADVIVVATASHHLWTFPLAVLSRRVEGLHALVVRQLGPSPQSRVVAFDDARRAGASRRVFTFSHLRDSWACISLSWRTETCLVYEDSQRVVLVAADMPPFPISAGTRIVPTYVDVNFWYNQRFSHVFGEKHLKATGLVFGDYTILYDSHLDSARKRL